jgi:endonuclease/exonuclease/phosphatase (EEP) superfamily protein YafD
MWVKTCKEVEEHPVISLLVMNVYMPNRNVEGALKIVRTTDPDIFIGIETDHWWNNNLGVLKKDYPYHVLVPQENTYGILIYSKLKLVNPEIKYMCLPDVPSIHTEFQIKTGDFVKLYALHPKPPIPGHSRVSTPKDAELLAVGKETRKDKDPVIVAGDLNDVAWSYTTNLFQRYSELLDPRKGRGMYNTYHAKKILWRWPLDHIFHSDHFQLVDIKTLPNFGSDHFPIYAKLCFMPANKHQQEEPSADEKDVNEATKKTSKA